MRPPGWILWGAAVAAVLLALSLITRLKTEGGLSPGVLVAWLILSVFVLGPLALVGIAERLVVAAWRRLRGGRRAPGDEPAREPERETVDPASLGPAGMALARASGGPGRPYSNHAFGRERDERCLSVVLYRTDTAATAIVSATDSVGIKASMTPSASAQGNSSANSIAWCRK